MYDPADQESTYYLNAWGEEIAEENRRRKPVDESLLVDENWDCFEEEVNG